MRKHFKSMKDGKSGFTLAETLVALLILLMVTSVVAAGIPAASNAYTKVVDHANAQVLLSTTVTALRNQIEFSKDVHLDPDDPTSHTLYFTSSVNGSAASICNSDKGVILNEYLDYTGDDENIKKLLSRPLVSDKAATKDLFLEYEGVSCSGEVVTFSGLKVIKKGTDTVLASVESIKFKVLSMD